MIFDFSHFKNKTAVITDKHEVYSYEQITQFSDLFSLQVSPRSLVFCLCKNEIGSLLGYIASLENRVVPLLLDASKDQELIFSLIKVYRPNFIWLSNQQEEYFKYGKVVFNSHGFSLLSCYNDVIAMNPELALLLTTSGSTGSPKLVRLSYKNLLSNAEAIANYLEINDKERPITTMPMHYTYGLSVINSHLLKGAIILLTDQTVMQKNFWSFAKENEATSIAGVPYTYEMLKRLKIFSMDLPNLKTFTQAGGKLHPNLAKDYIDYSIQSNKKFIIMYGQTEATARMSYLPFEKAQDKYGSIGIAIPGGSFQLMDESDNIIENANVDGELIYSGPNVSLGYAENKEDLKRGDDNHGLLHTGDIARKDEDGFYYITGRMKRFVKIFGNRVNLDAIEQLVKTITPSCASIGIDDHLTVFITESNKCNDVKNLLKTKTGLNSIAFKVSVINEIPISSSGKIDYSRLNIIS
jgi:acyl-CoA synthetase (AMP-forming)/AMP-acid ligase II